MPLKNYSADGLYAPHEKTQQLKNKLKRWKNRNFKSNRGDDKKIHVTDQLLNKLKKN